jgi:3-keto steroid reductase
VQTTLFPLNAFMFFMYNIVLYVARWLGSPWHPITAYNGACAPVWLALQEQAWLDGARAERVKWGTSTDRSGECRVKKTEVDGWGWEGRVEEVRALKSEHKLTGRRPGAVDVTAEKLVEFEELGAECWKRMEELRERWEERADAAEAAGQP